MWEECCSGTNIKPRSNIAAPGHINRDRFGLQKDRSGLSLALVISHTLTTISGVNVLRFNGWAD